MSAEKLSLKTCQKFKTYQKGKRDDCEPDISTASLMKRVRKVLSFTMETMCCRFKLGKQSREYTRSGLALSPQVLADGGPVFPAQLRKVPLQRGTS